MAIRGITSYMNNMYPRTGTGNGLANLLSRSSVNTEMLKKAYGQLSQKNGKTYKLTRSDTDNSISAVLSKYQINKAENIADSKEKLKTGSAAMFRSATNLLGAKNMKDKDFTAGVKQFVSDYNDTVKAAASSDNYMTSVSSKGMTDMTASYGEALKKVGITVNSDNTLKLDEDALKANSAEAKKLFGGSYSYGMQMAKKASELQTASRTAQNGTGIYNRYGGLFF